MALNGLFCAGVLLRNFLFTHTLVSAEIDKLALVLDGGVAGEQ